MSAGDIAGLMILGTICIAVLMYLGAIFYGSDE